MTKIVPTYEDGVWTGQEESGGGGSLPDPIVVPVHIAPTNADATSMLDVTGPADPDDNEFWLLRLLDGENGDEARFEVSRIGDADFLIAESGGGVFRIHVRNGQTLLRANSAGIGFYDANPVARPTGVAVDTAAIHAALVTLGLITA